MNFHEERHALAQAYVEACKACGHLGLAEAGVPATPARVEQLLGIFLSSDELAAWTRTPKSGHLLTRRSELRRAVHYPPIARLIELSRVDKKLSSFDLGLSARISPVTGRIHADYRVAGTVSGRVSCARPNLQQIPRDRPLP